MDEVQSAIASAKNNKAPGIDGIPFEFYKNAPTNLINEIHRLFCDIFSTGTIPESFKMSIMFPLYKKGNPNDVANYRGLSFMDTIYKLFTTVLLNRLNRWVEENQILKEFQAAYRQNYSTVDQIFNLSCLIKLQLNQKKKLYAFFIDLKAAFDNINRGLLFHKLRLLGMSTKMLLILKALYHNNTATVWNGTNISDFFHINRGVKQGCVLSALLFILFLNDLDSDLPGGVTIEGISVKVLLYADDIVLLCDNPASLQIMINSFANYCAKWNLLVNLGKSEIVIFRNGGRRAADEKWTFNNDEIKISNKYKYLGVTLTYNMSWTEHLMQRLAMSKNSINATWSNFIKNTNIQHSAKYKIYEAASKSVMNYCAQVWGYSEHDAVEKLQRFFIKRCFSLPSNTPNYVLSLETGLPKAFLSTLELHFKYIQRVSTLPENRLPRKLSDVIVRKKIYWANEWSELFNEVNIEFNWSTKSEWKALHTETCTRLIERHWTENTNRAHQSRFHDEYCNLSYAEVPNYFEDSNSREMISMVLKSRCGLLNLNARAFRRDSVGICTICNLDATENTYHFVGVCPCFRAHRRQFLGSESLNRDQFLEYLNGRNYSQLYNFIKNALRYRNLIINEYS